jgi:hypothetical protein
VKKFKNEEPDRLQRLTGPEPIKPLIQWCARENPEARVQGTAICNDPYGCAASSPHFLTIEPKTCGSS